MGIRIHYPLLDQRRTKIVVTLGPASDAPETIQELLEAGANVFRINLAHGDHESHRLRCLRVRRAAARRGVPVALMADLCGPKLRVGRFENGGVFLERDAELKVSTRPVKGRPDLIPCPGKGLLDGVKSGDRLLLKDGLLELLVLGRVSADTLRCKVQRGGELRDCNGIHLPGATFRPQSLTTKDRRDAAFAAKLGVDFIALSFARTAEDVKKLRSCLRRHQGAGIPIIAKIERIVAMENINEILEVADGIMVARGDLGVELQPERVPFAQRELILQARLCYKPVIVATQMLESMLESQRPTRAEVTDVAHAVGDGSDAVMLSGETAVGRYPVESVRMMDRILRQAEGYNQARGLRPISVFERVKGEKPRIGAAIAQAAAGLAEQLSARALVVLSRSGMSAATLCAVRPDAPVVVITTERATYQRMALHWGAIPVLTRQAQPQQPNLLARRIAGRLELARKGDFILLVQGFAADPKKNIPSLSALKI